MRSPRHIWNWWDVDHLLTRHGRFATLLICSLAVGIGLSTIVFVVFDRIMVTRLPYPEPDQVVFLPGVPVRHTQLGIQVLPGLLRLPVFVRLGMYREGALNLSDGPEPIRIAAAAVDSGFFEVLGTQPVIGRTFVAAEENQRVAVVSSHLWHHVLGRSALDRPSISLNSRTFTVIGVMPSTFQFPLRSQVWVPPLADLQVGGTAYQPEVLGRIVNRTSMLQVASDVSQALATEYGLAAGPKVQLVPLKDRIAAVSTAELRLVAVLTVCILCATWINGSVLWASRLLHSARDIALKRALGAQSSQLAKGPMMAATVAAVIAGVIGLVAGIFGLRALPTFIQDMAAESLGETNGRLLLIWLCLVAATVVMSNGLVFYVTRRIGAGPIVGRTVSATSISRGIQRWLAIVQATLATFLIACMIGVAGILHGRASIDLGFNGRNAFIFGLSLPASRYPTTAATHDFLERLAERLRQMPGIAATGAIDLVPGERNVTAAMKVRAAAVDGQTAEASSLGPLLGATPGYFSAIGIRTVAGRVFEPDDWARRPRVLIASETAARRLASVPAALVGRSVVGPDAERFEIIGVVADVRAMGPKSSISGELYQPLRQADLPSSLALVVAGMNERVPIVGIVRNAARELDPQIPLYDVRSVDNLKWSFLRPEITALIVGVLFAVGGIGLCMVGLFSMLSYMVTERSGEIGIRMALGATRGQIGAHVLAIAVRLAASGAAIGSGLVIAVFQFLSRSLPSGYRPPPDALFWAGLIVIVCGCVAALAPCRQAVTIDPSELLRRGRQERPW